MIILHCHISVTILLHVVACYRVKCAEISIKCNILKHLKLVAKAYIKIWDNHNKVETHKWTYSL